MPVRKNVIRYVTYDDSEFSTWELACAHEAKLWLKKELMNRDWVERVADDIVKEANELANILIEYRRLKERTDQ